MGIPQEFPIRFACQRSEPLVEMIANGVSICNTGNRLADFRLRLLKVPKIRCQKRRAKALHFSAGISPELRIFVTLLFFLILLKPQRNRIDAVPLARRRRPVIKDMAEMGAARWYGVYP